MKSAILTISLMMALGCKQANPAKPEVHVGKVICPSNPNFGGCILRSQADYTLVNQIKLPPGFHMEQHDRDFVVVPDEGTVPSISCTTTGSNSSCITGINGSVTMTITDGSPK